MANYSYDDHDGVLKNRLGVTNPHTLEEIEGRFVAARRAEMLAGVGPAGQFDAAHLKAIHRHLFQDIYEWAGQTRDERVPLSDGTIASEPVMLKAEGVPFASGTAIPSALDALAGRLGDNDCLRGLPRAEFAEQAADVMAELNAIHPFREGNGRTQRAFITELAKEAGHGLDFSVISQERMVQASIAAHERADNGPMRRMFDEISNPERVNALRQAIGSLERQDFPWNDRYLATLEPGHEVELTMAGIAGDHFMGRTSTDILVGRTSDLPEKYPERGEVFTITPMAWELDEPERDDEPEPDFERER